VHATLTPNPLPPAGEGDDHRGSKAVRRTARNRFSRSRKGDDHRGSKAVHRTSRNRLSRSRDGGDHRSNKPVFGAFASPAGGRGRAAGAGEGGARHRATRYVLDGRA